MEDKEFIQAVVTKPFPPELMNKTPVLRGTVASIIGRLGADYFFTKLGVEKFLGTDGTPYFRLIQRRFCEDWSIVLSAGTIIALASKMNREPNSDVWLGGFYVQSKLCGCISIPQWGVGNFLDMMNEWLPKIMETVKLTLEAANAKHTIH